MFRLTNAQCANVNTCLDAHANKMSEYQISSKDWVAQWDQSDLRLGRATQKLPLLLKDMNWLNLLLNCTSCQRPGKVASLVTGRFWQWVAKEVRKVATTSDKVTKCCRAATSCPYFFKIKLMAALCNTSWHYGFKFWLWSLCMNVMYVHNIYFIHTIDFPRSQHLKWKKKNILKECLLLHDKMVQDVLMLRYMIVFTDSQQHGIYFYLGSAVLGTCISRFVVNVRWAHLPYYCYYLELLRVFSIATEHQKIHLDAYE